MKFGQRKMSYRDLHNKPFDKGTIAKLDIFESYAKAWIPTFVMQKKVSEIHIFDFFSGPGFDSNNIPGSPIRILQKIDEQLENILAQKTKIVLHLNEYEPKNKVQNKFEQLKNNCKNYISNHTNFNHFLTVKYYNENTEELFFKLLPFMRKFPSLVYLDQNGVKFISQKYLTELEKLTKIDFLYFVSSSYFKRLGRTSQFRKILDIKILELEREEYRNMHRLIIDKMKSCLPNETELKLFPFTIKKKTNIYGIIFGAKNYAAIDKFLDIAWKRNSVNGEADFDIDEDKAKSQLDIFVGKKMTKVEKFQREFEAQLLDGKLPNNKLALLYTYECGHIPKHAADIVKKLKKQNKIVYTGSTRVQFKMSLTEI